MNYAQIRNDVVGEVVTQEAFDTFNPVVQALFMQCPDHVTPGYTLTTAGAWVAPVVVPVIAAVMLTPTQFYLAFTPSERVAIKTSIDPMVKEFWETYQLLASTNTAINTALNSVSSGLAYLKQLGILASDARVAAISEGQPA